ncbi:MAG: transcription-repair coupling factor [Bacilli bacterium]|jgi:transcription-repair coupling factor (superfamily II helicase)|nr:transcription-repair coupling factor [Bacilli bacterium]
MEFIKLLKDYPLENGYAQLDVYEEALLLVKNFHGKETILVIKDTLYQANRLYNELLYYLNEEELALFAYDEALVIESIASSDDLKIKNCECLYKCSIKQPMIIITHTLGIIRSLMDVNKYKNNIIDLKLNDVINRDDFINNLINLGYQRVSKVSSLNEFSIRGDIIDIYTITNYLPIRIELFDDIVESIRTFDINEQRSKTKLDNIKIYNASYYDYEIKDEILDNIKKIESDEDIINHLINMKDTNIDLFFSRYYSLASKKSSLIDYLYLPIIITSSLDHIKNKAINLNEESYQYLKNMHQEKKAIYDYKIFYDVEEVLYDVIDIKTYASSTHDKAMNLYEINKFNSIELFKNDLLKHLKDDYQVVICLKKSNERDIIIHLLNEEELIFDNEINNNEQIILLEEEISRGFINYEQKIIVYSDKELFNKVVKRKKRRVKYENAIEIDSIDDIKIGDYIVHDIHGIGLYQGITKLKADNIMKDYLMIEYKNNEKVYIPIEKFNLIRKYSGKDGYVPKINNVGGSEWTKIKRKVKKKIEDMMDELLKLYAARKAEIGFCFSEDNSLQEQFENDFEYELTRDQAKALIEVKEDMQSNKVMDRLICGDVGFGKTEVAIRAMFKAILNNKQCAFLCPTTILARQHFNTLKERFLEYGISVVILTRNTSAKMFKQIIEDVKNRKIDIVVGTHKVLNAKLEFNDLGLLVIDEEQRFGVKDKEKIKQIKNNVDVLTLSATPIPRTLQMSLTGIRKMSLLQTPPVNRVPIQTYVVEKNQYLIKEVIERELSRQGQVFYLYNRTSNIDSVANNLQDQFIDAKVGVIHGKLSKAEIEETMEKFDNNEYQILVCTTIIETGIDIPNVNTIIIEDANKFGLAQLYQIKGRVGRSDRIAYAYLLYQKDKIINENAIKRLQAIKELTQLGSGYKIALRDLNIRGAGDLLGKSQAGNIDAVGYDMFIDMLEEEINNRKGIKKEDKVINNIEISNTGYIPENYTIDDANKIELYQNIYSCISNEELDRIVIKIEDNYGNIPQSIKDIISKRRIDIYLNKLKYVTLKDNSEDVELHIKMNVANKELLKEVMNMIEDASLLFKIVIMEKEVKIIHKKNKNYLEAIIVLLNELTKIK